MIFLRICKETGEQRVPDDPPYKVWLAMGKMRLSLQVFISVSRFDLLPQQTQAY